LEAGATWTRGLGTTLSLFLSTQLPTIRATTSITAPARGVLRRHGSSQTTRLGTFSDGGFYLIGVKPGEYELSVDPSVLARLGLSAGPIAFTVPSSAEGATVDGLELRLE
jgi:hypothetical protein